MTELSRLPTQLLAPLGSRSPQALRREARALGHRFLHADCADAADKPGVMAALARGLKLPKHFGANLDALYDCLTDLEPGARGEPRGLVLVVEHLPGPPGFDESQRDALLEVFRDAADDFAGRGIAFRVFWSLSPGDPASP